MLTKERYEAIICMLRGGATDEVIKTSMGINDTTLTRVKKSNGSWEEYRRLHGEHMQNVAQKKVKKDPEPQIVETRQSVTIVANQYMAEQLKKQTELLTLISNKLANIMENIEIVKEAWK